MMAATLQLLSRDGPISWQIGSQALPGQTKGIHAAAMAVDEAICLKTRQLSHGDHCGILPAPMNVNVIAIVNASANGTETGSVIETGTAANVSVNGIESANGNAAEMMKEQHAVAVDEENAHENMSGSEAAEVTLSHREKYCDGQEAAEAHVTKPAVGSAASETREATRRRAAALSMKAVSGLRRPWGLYRLRRLHRRLSQAVLKTNDDGAVAVSANASATGIEHGNETTTETVAAVAVEQVIASVDAPETTEEHMVRVVVVAEEEEEEEEEECG